MGAAHEKVAVEIEDGVWWWLGELQASDFSGDWRWGMVVRLGELKSVGALVVEGDGQ